MLNRDLPPVRGLWNGVGGKVEEGESPHACVRRDVEEETGLLFREEEFQYKGTISWAIDEAQTGGMYAFIVDVPEDFKYSTPVKIGEGILDWKRVSWMLEKDNHGLSPMIPYYLQDLLKEDGVYHHHFNFDEGRITDYIKEKERLDIVVP